MEATLRTSWDEVEEAYRGDLDDDHIPEMLVFVQQLRAKGYDRTLRAGRSMGNLILSRSRANHLRPDQPTIGFVLSGDGRMHVSYRNRPVLDAPSIALTSDIERLSPPTQPLKTWPVAARETRTDPIGLSHPTRAGVDIVVGNLD